MLALSASATSSHNHNVNDQRKPFKMDNSTSSSSTSNAAPLNTRDQNHSQRSASYPHGDGLHYGNRRNFQIGNHSHRS
ncbi:hypothetical protein Bca4012_059323 [Brassica carinata]